MSKSIDAMNTRNSSVGLLCCATLLVQPTNEVLAGDDCRGIFYFDYITGCVFYVQESDVRCLGPKF